MRASLGDSINLSSISHSRHWVEQISHSYKFLDLKPASLLVRTLSLKLSFPSYNSLPSSSRAIGLIICLENLRDGSLLCLTLALSLFFRSSSFWVMDLLKWPFWLTGAFGEMKFILRCLFLYWDPVKELTWLRLVRESLPSKSMSLELSKTLIIFGSCILSLLYRYSFFLAIFALFSAWVIPRRLNLLFFDLRLRMELVKF